MRKPRTKGLGPSWILPFLGPLVLGALLFIYTVEARKPWFGVLGMGHHQWNTAKSMIFTDNWIQEGPWDLGFGLFQNPGSIEFPTRESREVYPPYPPGAMVPLYGLAQLAGSHATPGLVMGYNLACHFLIALFLGWTLLVFLLSLGMRGLEAGLFSLIPVLVELLLPGPLYFHQNVYFVDQAVLLPFVLALFLEVLRDKGREGKHSLVLAWAQGAVFFIGFMTDWLFLFLGLAVYFKRVLTGTLPLDRPGRFFRETFRFWAPWIAAMTFYAWQVLEFGQFRHLVGRLLYRTGLKVWEGEERIAGSFEGVFWGKHAAMALGEPLVWALLASFLVLGALWVLRRVKDGSWDPCLGRIFALACLFLLPCLGHIYFFMNLSYIHDFSAEKLSLPACVLPFLLLPVGLWRYFFGKVPGEVPSAGAQGRPRLSWVPLLMLVLCAGVVGREHGRFRELFPLPGLEMKEVGGFIRRNVEFKDVVFSPVSEVPMVPPFFLSYTHKRVYWIGSWEDLRRRARDLPEGSRAALFVTKDRNPFPWKELKALSVDTRQEGDLFLFKVPLASLRGAPP